MPLLQTIAASRKRPHVCIFTDGLWVGTVRHKSTFGEESARQQRVFPRHDTAFASVFALFAVDLAVADQAAPASAGWGHAAAWSCGARSGGSDWRAARGGRRPRRQEQGELRRRPVWSDCKVSGDTAAQISLGEEPGCVCVGCGKEDSRPLRIAMGVTPRHGGGVQSVPGLEEGLSQSGMGSSDVGWRSLMMIEGILHQHGQRWKEYKIRGDPRAGMPGAL